MALLLTPQRAQAGPLHCTGLRTQAMQRWWLRCWLQVPTRCCKTQTVRRPCTRLQRRVMGLWLLRCWLLDQPPAACRTSAASHHKPERQALLLRPPGLPLRCCSQWRHLFKNAALHMLETTPRSVQWVSVSNVAPWGCGCCSAGCWSGRLQLAGQARPHTASQGDRHCCHGRLACFLILHPKKASLDVAALHLLTGKAEGRAVEWFAQYRIMPL